MAGALAVLGTAALVLSPPRGSRPRRRDRARGALRAGRPARRAARGVRPRRAVRAERRRRVPRRGDGVAARPWRSNDLVEIAPGATTSARALRVQPRLPRRRAEPRLRLRALGAAHHRGHGADRVRPRRERARAPRAGWRSSTGSSTPSTTGTTCTRATGRWSSSSSRPEGRGGARRDADRDRVQPARGRERAAWDDDKLELVDGTHPVVHPAAGSHANFFDEGLHLGRSAEQGVGCDDTTGPDGRAPTGGSHDPERSRRAARGLPVDRLRGALGRAPEGVLQRPDRPEPEVPVDGPDHLDRGWRDRSYAVPAGGHLGTDATDFFCSAVAKGRRSSCGWPTTPAPCSRSSACSPRSSSTC